MKNYWFALKSHIYVEFKTKFTLLYDTVSGERIESELEEGNALIRQMYEPLNLGDVYPLTTQRMDRRNSQTKHGGSYR